MVYPKFNSKCLFLEKSICGRKGNGYCHLQKSASCVQRNINNCSGGVNIKWLINNQQIYTTTPVSSNVLFLPLKCRIKVNLVPFDLRGPRQFEDMCRNPGTITVRYELPIHPVPSHTPHWVCENLSIYVVTMSPVACMHVSSMRNSPCVLSRKTPQQC